MNTPPYLELQAATNFSFLRGASHPEELFATAKFHGYAALGIADFDTVAGIVRAHVAAEAMGMRLIAGCRLSLTDGSIVLAYPTDRAAWGRLCRLLTLGNKRGDRQTFQLSWDDLAREGAGVILILHPQPLDDRVNERLIALKRVLAPGEPAMVRGYLGLTRHFRPGDIQRLTALQTLADRHGVPTVVVGDVLYHTPERTVLQDIVTAIRCGRTMETLGEDREYARDRHLKSPADMARLYAGFEDALGRSLEIAAACRFSVADLRYQPKGALREVGKVMGLSDDLLGLLSKHLASALGDPDVLRARAAELHLDLSERRLSLTLAFATRLLTFPRQLGTHPGGFVLTRDRLDALVPVQIAAMEDRQIIVWDKDDIDALKFMKVDVLGLGMLGCLRRCFEFLESHHHRRLDIATIPAEDPATYAMIRKADTLGTFQIESRAQMSMLPRLRPTTFYDLVVQVAIVRPGPIQDGVDGLHAASMCHDGVGRPFRGDRPDDSYHNRPGYRQVRFSGARHGCEWKMPSQAKAGPERGCSVLRQA